MKGGGQRDTGFWSKGTAENCCGSIITPKARKHAFMRPSDAAVRHIQSGICLGIASHAKRLGTCHYSWILRNRMATPKAPSSL